MVMMASGHSPYPVKEMTPYPPIFVNRPCELSKSRKTRSTAVPKVGQKETKTANIGTRSRTMMFSSRSWARDQAICKSRISTLISYSRSATKKSKTSWSCRTRSRISILRMPWSEEAKVRRPWRSTSNKNISRLSTLSQIKRGLGHVRLRASSRVKIAWLAAN